MTERRSMNGCADFWQTRRTTRRDILRVGGLGALGLTLPGLLRAEAAGKVASRRPTAKSVIMLFNFGGPSQLETFDMKPHGSADARGEFKPIPTRVPGFQVCELLPRMARLTHKFAVIRSVHHERTNHNSAAATGLSGFMPPTDFIVLRDTPEQMPAYGSVIDKFRPSENGMPGFVSMPMIIRDATQSPGQHAGYLGKKHDPLMILRDPNSPDFKLPELSLPESLDVDRLQDRRTLRNLLNRRIRSLEGIAEAQGLSTYHERAFSLLSSSDVQAAFDLTQEPDTLRDEYGRTTFGQCSLLARRLVERGVRLVTVFYARPSGGMIWDTHKDHFKQCKESLLPITDQTVAALLTDLDQRGLLDETLVFWTGEFGRTPKVNSDAGRDHWPQAYSVMLAGGGIRGGALYGATDDDGAYPVENPVTPANVSGTIYHAMGIDPHTEIHDRLGRPFPIADDPILDLFS